MSADNGVYILRSRSLVQGGFEFRVVHAQAIDSIHWKPDREGFNTEEIRACFGGAKVLYTEKEASAEAAYIADQIMADELCPILEYGICNINLPFPFPIQKENTMCNETDKTVGCDHSCCSSSKESDVAVTNILLGKIENVALETKRLCYIVKLLQEKLDRTVWGAIAIMVTVPIIISIISCWVIFAY